MRNTLKFLLVSMMLAVAAEAQAFSLALDSIAEMGRFAKFCVDTYRWGDRTFSSYDSLYVVSTGYKFALRPQTEYWSENYRFTVDDFGMTMSGEDFLSAGISSVPKHQG